MPTTLTPPRSQIVYPDSDGMPMADNTKQAWWIVLLWSNLASIFSDMADVFVAMDHLWYPVEGEPKIRAAPDVYVVFGRPKGHRGSYKQWEEEGIAPQVVFEILSPGNDYGEMIDKQLFYEEYGVREYYVYDPDNDSLVAYLRNGRDLLHPKRIRTTFTSPLLKIRFDLTGEEMVVFGPDGQRFRTVEELNVAQREAERKADEARQQADEARQQADEARQQADEARQQRDRLAELGRKITQGTASADELAEFQHLVASAP